MFHLEGIVLSKKFCFFLSDNFADLLFAATGLRPSSKITLAGFKQAGDIGFYEKGQISKLHLVLWIMPDFYNNISFCWKSKTDRTIEPTHEDFDEDNLECWLEGLKPAEYWKQIATEKKSHPFQVKTLPFEVKVFAFDVNMVMRLNFNGQVESSPIQNIIANCIVNFNQDSEKISRKNGVVHNFDFDTGENKLVLRIDTGSAGFSIINKILATLKKVNNIQSIELDI